MKTKRNYIVRVLLLVLVMSWSWSGVVFGQTAATTGLSLSNFPSDGIVKQTVSYAEAGNTLNIDLSSQLQEITNTLNSLNNTNVSTYDILRNLYLRWYIINTTNNNIIDIANTAWSINGVQSYFNYRLYNSKHLVYNANHAEAWIIRDNYTSDEVLKIAVTKPTSELWSNYKVICCLTNDLSGINPNNINTYDQGNNFQGTLTQEPNNLKMKFEITLGLMSTLPLKHNYRPGDSPWNTLYTTDQVEGGEGPRYQKTAKWTYNVYVMPKEEVNLILPLQDLVADNGTIRGGNSKADGSSTEPHAYYRWYDYKTDLKHTKTSIYRGTALKDYSWGYWLYNYTQKATDSGYDSPICSDIGVIKYTASDSDTFEDVVACDVSDYHDYSFDENGFKEPTITIRYIFNIRPASEQAVKIKEGFKTWSFLENNGYVTLNCRDNNTEFTLRAEERLPSDYHFYPLNNGVTNVETLTDSDFNTSTILAGKTIVWYVRYNGAIVLTRIASTKKNQRFFTFKRNELTGIPDNSDFEVFAYVVKDDVTGTPELGSIRQKGAPINYNVCKFASHRATLTHDEVYNNDTYKYRTYDFLNSRYQLAGEINFDGDGENCDNYDYSEPSEYTNMRYYPQDIENSSYGFVYPSLSSIKTPFYSLTWSRAKSPVHGEYGYYKTANIDGISRTDQGYNWWYTQEGTEFPNQGNFPHFYDRTYHTSGGTKYGYFMYTDASDESRPLASFDVVTKLCAGSALIFTGWIADLTGGDMGVIKPQVMFKIYGVDDDGKATLLQSMLSEVVPGVAQWRQFYADIILQPKDVNIDYEIYRVAIDNYSKGTDGADYAIDDIRMFIKTSEVEIMQEKTYCEDETTKIKIDIGYDEIVTKLGLQSTETIDLRYYLVDEDDVKIELGKDSDNQPVYELTDELNGDYVADILARPTKYEVRNSINYFILQDRLQLNLDPSKNYYLMVDYKRKNSQSWKLSKRGDICSIVSNPFKVQEEEIIIKDLDGKVITSYEIGCTATGSLIENFTATLSVPDNNGDRHTFDNVNFSWYLNDVMSIELKDALYHLWMTYPSLTGKGSSIDWSKIVASGSLTAGDIALLMANKDYLIINTRQLNNITLIEGANTYTAIALATTLPINGTDVTLCDGFLRVNINVVAVGAPKIYLGFADADKESTVLRMGLGQFKEMKEGKSLLVPIKDYSNGAAIRPDKQGSLLMVGDHYLNLIATNDPTIDPQDLVAPYAYGIANLTELKTLKNTTEYSALFSFFGSGLSTFNPHEGYWYKVRFEFQNEDIVGNTCQNSVTFTIKIVPEYLTFTGAGGNWSNDENWIRTPQAVLYKDVENQNSDSYTDYAEPLLHQGYVPMKFTKVTVTADAEPLLYPVTISATTNVLDLTKPESMSQDATTDIEYDMLVKELPPATSYSCEKFYTNTCDQIYFKPAAELYNQHLLTYNKAWVDIELDANRWYMLASPLQGVVAGDMYLPLVSRRQETEAFKDITFDTDLVLHNRSLMPVYQRSWDKSSSLVYKPDNSTYDAYIATKATWSHVYNDVAVDYSQQGFSIKADKKDGMGKVLFRLPKNDTQYRYYKYDDVTNNITSTPNTTTISRTNAYKLRADKDNSGEVTVSLLNHNHGELYLLSNPYMASLDMAQFFATNTNLETKYWLVDANEQRSYVEGALGYVAPLQSFLVKKNTGSVVANASFTPAMTVVKSPTAGGVLTRTMSEIPQLRLIAHRDGAKSTAMVMQHPEASDEFADHEDAEALFDSNLSDIPTIYTVAGQQVVAINQVNQLGTLPLGIYSGSNATVDVEVAGVESLDVPIYLYDAMEGTRVELHSGDVLAMPGNTAGRYYLMTEELMELDVASDLNVFVKDSRAYIEARGQLTIDQVTVYDSGGQVVEYIEADHQPTCEVPLPARGVYVLRIVTNEGTMMQKVMN